MSSTAFPPPPAELADLIPLASYPARRYRDIDTGAYRLAVWRFGRFDVLGQNPNEPPGWCRPSFTELLKITATDLRRLLATGALVQDDAQ